MKKLVLVFVLLFAGNMVNAACPRTDVTGDCKVDLADFAIMASEWLSQGYPESPEEMAWVSINDSGVPGHEVFNGEMSRYETTNAQFCQFLNAAIASDDITVSNNYVLGANGSNPGADFVGETYFKISSPIAFDGCRFSIQTRKDTSDNDIDVSNHPVVGVSWYGATAFCNYYGYRLPTEWEWQAVADYDGNYTFGCGTSINTSKANYYAPGYNPINLFTSPYTTPVDHYDSYGYGMNDMAGNAYEWTSTVNGSYRIIRGGSWVVYGSSECNVASSSNYEPHRTDDDLGFRVCR